MVSANGGGSAVAGNSSPSLGGSITIGGNTVSVGGAAIGFIEGVNDGTGAEQHHSTADGIGTLELAILSNNALGMPATIDAPFTYTGAPGDSAFGDFNYIGFNGLDLVPETLTETIPGTPLPAALPLFATAIGALGLLGWRRKKKAAPLTA